MKERIRAALHAVEERADAARRAVKRKTGLRDPIRPRPYRGWGAGSTLHLSGRVLEDEGVQDMGGDLASRVWAMWKRYESDEIPGARLEVRLGDRSRRVEADDEGYFELAWEDVPLEAPWTELSVQLLSPVNEDQDNPPVPARVRVPGPQAKIALVSDVDDTIVKTGATDFLKHARTVLLNDASSREAFAGAGAFYRAIEAGRSGDEGNPVFYVSSSPWNLYSLFESFLELNDIPLGPIFLKDFGVDDDKLLKEGHTDYKVDRITRLIDAYPGLGFLLVGDSGQKDAWVFEEVVRQRQGRVLGCYLRDLDPSDADPEIAKIEARMRERGTAMLRVPDMAQAARHATEQGWISDDARAAVERATDGRQAAGDQPDASRR